MAPSAERPRHPYIQHDHPLQLEMVRPSSLGFVPVAAVPKEYLLRQFQPEDESRYDDLFHLAFVDEGRIPEAVARTLDGGFFVVEHLTSKELVASCVAMRGSSSPRHKAGQLGWLVTDPSHARKGLGRIAAASATNRLVAERYPQPFLGTEDARLPAISLYLSQGWRPHLYAEDMEPRWRSIYQCLGCEFVRGPESR